MAKIGVCGVFGEGMDLLNGQTVKTKVLTQELISLFGLDSIKTIDTFNWKNNKIKLLFNCFKLINKCENIILLPAHNGVKVFPLIFLIMNILFKKKIHYVVIGGWLPNLLRENKWLLFLLCKLDGIYVETQRMLVELNNLGLKNVYQFPNFKRLNILTQKELIYNEAKPYRLCTFSRVLVEKGIEDAINAVIDINNDRGEVVFTLDIYGQIDESYSSKFENLITSFPEYISYKGSIKYSDSVKVLKKYFALLFPTHYKTEGIPGTIIDAYAAGVPVIASEWDSSKEIIIHKKTGFVFDFKNQKKLKEVLILISNDSEKINLMKKNCIAKAHEFSPDSIVGDFVKYLD